MPRLYFIRHGETDFNVQNIVQGGGVDSDLNETGRNQGLRFFERYQNITFDRIYCTALRRTYQTVQHFEAKGHEIVRLPELNEFNWGAIEGAPATPEVRALFEELTIRWSSGDLDAAVERGETPLAAWQRAEAGLQRILQETPADGSALVCFHGRISRIVLSQMLGYGMRNMNLFPHHNTALNLVHVHPSGRCAIERLNDLSHLL